MTSIIVAYWTVCYRYCHRYGSIRHSKKTTFDSALRKFSFSFLFLQTEKDSWPRKRDTQCGARVCWPHITHICSSSERWLGHTTHCHCESGLTRVGPCAVGGRRERERERERRLVIMKTAKLLIKQNVPRTL